MFTRFTNQFINMDSHSIIKLTDSHIKVDDKEYVSATQRGCDHCVFLGTYLCSLIHRHGIYCIAYLRPDSRSVIWREIPTTDIEEMSKPKFMKLSKKPKPTYLLNFKVK